MIFTPEHEELRRTVRTFVEKELNPHVREWEDAGRFPIHEVFKKMGDLGLLGVTVPEAYGGPGLDLTTTCMAKELVARVSMTGAQLINQNTISFALPLLHFGSEAQRRQWLPIVAKGGVVSSVAITEPHAGSDVGAMKTRVLGLLNGLLPRHLQDRVLEAKATAPQVRRRRKQVRVSTTKRPAKQAAAEGAVGAAASSMRPIGLNDMPVPTFAGQPLSARETSCQLTGQPVVAS